MKKIPLKADVNNRFLTWLEKRLSDLELFTSNLKKQTDKNTNDIANINFTVDNELSNTSENPVQNKVINEQISSLWYNKLDYIEYDSQGNKITHIGSESDNIDKAFFKKLYVDGIEFTNNSAFINNKSETDYFLTPQDFGSETQGERQVFIQGNSIPINIMPYDLSSIAWRTYYIVSWNYHVDINQTQVLFIASDPTAIINVVYAHLNNGGENNEN